jgi:hypothetical protein
MKWIKKGRIFEAKDIGWESSLKEFAQSPQALVLEDRIRVYFSTRRRDREGVFVSEIAYADLDRTNPTKVVSVSTEKVIDLGGLGCFDEHGIFPISPTRVDDRVYAYTCGWSRRVSVPVETSVGLAVSEDGGKTFIKTGPGPIFTSSIHEPYLVGDAFVRRYNGTFYMWYIFGVGWTAEAGEPSPARVYKIAQAESNDGVNWERVDGRRVVPDRLNENECQALPTVLLINDRWHMFFCYREATDFRTNSSRGYRIGYAYSGDLIDWHRDDANAGIDVSESGWDSEMMCYPNVFAVDGKTYMLYNGNEFGRWGFGLAELVSV